jgi:16S rRNA (guanine966-N2)-methyltransferase
MDQLRITYSHYSIYLDTDPGWKLRCEKIESDAMRVISGKYRSRQLRALRGLDIRPSSDRLRETLFNVVCARHPAVLEGLAWLDLYAGTGAVGIEAISRGAGMVCFVESSKKARELIVANLKFLGISAGFQIIGADVAKSIPQLKGAKAHFDYVFLDPPYRLQEEYEKTLTGLSESSVITSDSIVIAEHQKRFQPGERFGSLELYRTLLQGDAGLSFYRKSG